MAGSKWAEVILTSRRTRRETTYRDSGLSSFSRATANYLAATLALRWVDRFLVEVRPTDRAPEDVRS